MRLDFLGSRPRALPWARPFATLLLLGFASGCATVRPQRGIDEVEALIDARLAGNVSENRSRPDRDASAAWLEEPLTAERAVRVALVRNPDIQIAYARLGISRADVIDAARIGNPTFSVSSLRPSDGGRRQLTTALVQPFADLVLLSSRKRLAAAEFAIVQREIAGDLLDLAADVERDWYRYVAARQIAAMRAAVSEAASVSADLAQRFYDAGNLTPLNLALEKAAAAQARIDAADATADALRARLRLARGMGVSATMDWEASANLAAPVALEDAFPELAQIASRQRVDLDAAEREIAVRSSIVDTTRRFRWLGQFDIGIERERETDGSRLTGPTLDVSLPIFNQGQGSVARAQALRERARARLAGLELSIENDLRSASEGVAVAREIVAEYANALVPLREAVVARTQENVNFMLTGVFELLLAKREEYDTYEKYLEAVRDYWLARVELSRAIGGRLPSDAQIESATVGVESILNPTAPEGGGHSGHNMGAMKDIDSPTPSPPEDHSSHNMENMQDKTAPTPSPTDDHSGHDMSGMKDAAEPAAAPAEVHSDHDMRGMQDADPPEPAEADPKAAEPPVDPHQGHQDQRP